jgi:cyclopropane fatty-acyl-phospholipid synthase-like methyltransferase
MSSFPQQLLTAAAVATVAVVARPMGFHLDTFEFILWFAEFLPYFVGASIVAATCVRKELRIITALSAPLTLLFLTGGVIYGSHYGQDFGSQHNYDPSLPSVREAAEDYINTGKGDINEILESGKYKPSFGVLETTYLLKDLMRHTLWHSNVHNEDNIDEGYNKGNDWFEATLGEPMVYTSGIYEHGNETLLEAQNRKLDYVANAIDLQPGDNVLDIGCGWGRLAQTFADKYGANVWGVTLSSDQLAWANKNIIKGNPKVKLMLQNAMTMGERTDLPDGGTFDKITSLEMAEHVGIKRYQEFLTAVRSMLKDNGTLYFQVAGLRRHWQYEDLVWGLFMGEHVFPGADASVPLGWVTSQLERAGFEVQRTQNLGTHYSRTLFQWLEEWQRQEASLTKTYGAVAWRRWEVFLRWSVRVARQGSSTVFMITATKADDEPARIATQKRLSPKW